MSNKSSELDHMRAAMPLILSTLIVLGCRYDSSQTEAVVSRNGERPNFVFLLTDDQNYRTIRELGNKQFIAKFVSSAGFEVVTVEVVTVIVCD